MTNNTTVLVGDDGYSSIWLYSLYILEGLLITGSNLLICIVIFRYSALRNAKEYMVVFGLALADATLMIGFIFAGIRRLRLVYSGLHSSFMSPWECATVSHNIIWSFAGPISGHALLAISVDRLLAVSVPLRYIQWSRNYVYAMWGIVYGWCFVSGTIARTALVYGSRQMAEELNVRVPALCFMGSETMAGVNWFYVNYFEQGSQVCAFVSIVIYGLVWVIYKKSKAQVSTGPGNTEQKRHLAEQRRLTITLGISCLFTLFVYMIPRIVGFGAARYLSTTVRAVFFMVANLNPLFNIFIYSMRHVEMKQGLVALFLCKQMPDNIIIWKTNNQAKGSQVRTRTGVPKQK